MNNNLNIKDIVTVGILSSIAFALSMAGYMIILPLGNWVFYVQGSISALLSGAAFVVLCKKVPKTGVIFLFGVVFGLLYVLMGFWQMMTIILPGAIIAELIMIKDGYKYNKRLILSYIAFIVIVGFHGIIFLWVLGTAGIVESFPGMFSPEQLNTMTQLYYDPKIILLTAIIHAVFALMGSLFGISLYNRFFEAKRVNKEFGV